MDADRFDRLTRTLTAPLSRRVTLSGLAAGVLLSLGRALDESTVLAKKKGKGGGGGKGGGNGKGNKDCPKSQPNRCGDKCCKPSERCKKGKCINHCNDDKHNFGETDFDCGGTCRDIRKCSLSLECKEDADCFNNVCVQNPFLGRLACAECRESPDCGRLNNPLSHACHGGVCLECSRDADCPRPGQRPEQDKCIEPVDGQCPPGKPCVCRQCRLTADCPANHRCDETGTCTAGCLQEGASCTIAPDNSDSCCDSPEELSCLPEGPNGAFVCVT